MYGLATSLSIIPCSSKVVHSRGSSTLQRLKPQDRTRASKPAPGSCTAAVLCRLVLFPGSGLDSFFESAYSIPEPRRATSAHSALSSRKLPASNSAQPGKVSRWNVGSPTTRCGFLNMRHRFGLPKWRCPRCSAGLTCLGKLHTVGKPCARTRQIPGNQAGQVSSSATGTAHFT